MGYLMKSQISAHGVFAGKKRGARDYVWLEALVYALLCRDTALARPLTIAFLPRPITGTSPSNAELSRLPSTFWKTRPHHGATVRHFRFVFLSFNF